MEPLRNRFFAALLASAALPAHAQTCAGPVLLADFPLSGTTCGAEDSLPNFAGFSSPQPDYVMSFQAGPALSGHLSLSLDFGGAALLMRAPCSDSTPLDVLQAVPSAGGSFDVPVDDLAPGPYLVVVTGDPSGPFDACGTFTLTPHVEFDEDFVFANGFEP